MINLANIRPVTTCHMFHQQKSLAPRSVAIKSYWAAITNHQETGEIYNYTNKRSKECILARFRTRYARDTWLLEMAAMHDTSKAILKLQKNPWHCVEYLTLNNADVRPFFYGMPRQEFDIFIDEFPYSD